VAGKLTKGIVPRTINYVQFYHFVLFSSGVIILIGQRLLSCKRKGERIQMSQTVVLNVTGIKCGGCETAINKVLTALPGIVKAQASSQSHTVSVEFNPDQISLEAIQSAIAHAGYTVQAHG